MLVLSRRINETIVFPDFQTCVAVVGVKAGTVRLGITAPPEVTVLREEVANRAVPGDGDPAKLRHLLRNRLNTTAIGLALLRRQLQAGQSQNAAVTLATIDHEFDWLKQHLVTAASPVLPRSATSRRALLVEDDQNECELLAGFLRMAGLEVATAGDGGDALDFLRTQGKPDVVLLDMMLPRCDGPTTLRTIRSDPAYAGLKIFAVSGHTPERFNLGQDARVDRWFSKPLNPEALLQDLTRELQA